MRRALLAAVAIGATLGASTLSAKDELGVYGQWGAFRDAETPRCYAIAKPAPSRLRRDYEPYATVASWPRRKIRNQVHFQLSRDMAKDAPIVLQIGSRKFALEGNGGHAWAPDKRIDAAIVSAMRSANRMTIRTRGTNGRRFSNTYDLSRAATAMDAATIGCARL